MRNSFILSMICFGLLSAYVTPAAAYDPLCDQIKKPERRAFCQCRSDAGAAVGRRKNGEGRMIIDADRVRGPAKTAQVSDCMIKRGFNLG